MSALIFDLDGTLIDSREDITDAANHALVLLGEKPITVAAVTCHIGNGMRSLLGGILKTDDAVLIQKAVGYFREYYKEHCLEKTVLYTGVGEVLEYFANRQKKMAVVTNKDHEFTDKILEGLNISRYFQSKVGVRSGDKKKPHPDLLHRALEEMKSRDTLQCAPIEAVMIGDSPSDIEAGKKAGMKTCGVGYGIGNPEQVKEAGPDFWIQSPAELMKLF